MTIRRHRVDRATRNVSRQRRVFAVNQPVHEIQTRGARRFVAQQPLHTAAVETVRRGYSITAAHEDYAERVTPASGPLEFKFEIAAGRFDDQNNGRQRILNQRVDLRTGLVADPVDLRALT